VPSRSLLFGEKAIRQEKGEKNARPSHEQSDRLPAQALLYQEQRTNPYFWSIIGSENMLKIRTILHPTDFSQHADYAWQVACSLARDYGARLIVVHVLAPPTVGYGEFGMLPPEGADRESVEEQLAAIKPKDSSVGVTCFLLEGHGVTEILRCAKDNQCDLIVMGTHGRKGIGRLLMGSVAEQVVRKASCPVLTVKTPMAEIETGISTQAVPVNVEA
jgi:universal stress protein A